MTPPEFLIIPYQLVEDPDIHPLDERVYGVIYWLTRLKGEKCTAGNPTLAILCKTTPASLQNSLTALEKGRYIKRIFRDESRRTRKEIIPLIVFTRVSSTSDRRRKVSPTDDTVSPTDDTKVSPTGDQKKSIYNKKRKEEDTATQSVAGNQVNLFLDLFKSVNPSYERLFGNKTQRAAVERLLKKWGAEKIKELIGLLPKTNSMKYAPTITTPLQLEEKLGAVISFIQKEGDKKIIVAEV